MHMPGMIAEWVEAVQAALGHPPAPSLESSSGERQRPVAQLASDSDGSAEEEEGGYPAEDGRGEQAASCVRPSRSWRLNIDKKAPAVRLHLTASAGGGVQARVTLTRQLRTDLVGSQPHSSAPRGAARPTHGPRKLQFACPKCEPG